MARRTERSDCCVSAAGEIFSIQHGNAFCLIENVSASFFLLHVEHFAKLDASVRRKRSKLTSECRE